MDSKQFDPVGVKPPEVNNDNAGREPGKTRKQILDAALDIFALKGFVGAHVEEIAREAQTSKSAIYFHFPSKERLFLALADQFADLLERRVVAAVAGRSDGMGRVQAALKTCLETFGKYRKATKLLLAHGANLGVSFEQKRTAIIERFAGLIAVYLEEAIEEGQIETVNVEVVSLAWMGAIYAVVFHWIDTNEPDPWAILESLPPLLLKSVGYEPSKT